MGLANRASEQLRIRWDSGEVDSDQNRSPESNLKTLKIIGAQQFNLENFGAIDDDVIAHLAKLIDLDNTNKQNNLLESYSLMSNRHGSSPLNSPRATPKSSVQAMESSSVQSASLREANPSQSGQSEKPIARMFAGYMVQAATMRVIMLLFSSRNVTQITQTESYRNMLGALIEQASRPSSMELGVPLGDLVRSSNVMLASAMGQASPWDSHSSILDETEIINTSDEELEDDDDDDMMDTETEEEEEITQHSRQANPNTTGTTTTGVAAIETVLMEHQRRIRAFDAAANSSGSSQGQQTFGSSNSDTAPTQRQSILRPSQLMGSQPAPAPPPPPPPAPLTQLVEMGFSMAHVQRGMRRLNINANGSQTSGQVSTQIAMLASWLIENPQEPGEEPNAANQEPEEQSAENVDEPPTSQPAPEIRPLFDFENITEMANSFEVIDRSSSSVLVDGTESSTVVNSWPANVLSARTDSSPSIVEIDEDNNPKLKELYNIFKDGTMNTSGVDDLTTGLPAPPRKLLEIAAKLGLSGNDIPPAVKFSKPDPLGSSSILLENILDERINSSGAEIGESSRKYRLSQEIGKISMSWSEKAQVMASIMQATKVLTARNTVLRTLAIATVQVKMHIITINVYKGLFISDSTIISDGLPHNRRL